MQSIRFAGFALVLANATAVSARDLLKETKNANCAADRGNACFATAQGIGNSSSNLPDYFDSAATAAPKRLACSTGVIQYDLGLSLFSIMCSQDSSDFLIPL